MRTITVQGEATKYVTPNQIIMNFELVSKDKDYDTTVEKAAKQLTQLQEALASVGIKEDALKTSNFNITTEYRNESDSSGNPTRTFVGYQSYHALTLLLPLDMKKLSEVIDAITKSEALPEFTISFAYNNKKVVSEALLLLATKDATNKAKLLATALGVQLGEVQSIHYEHTSISLLSNTKYNTMNHSMLRSTPINITPEQIEVSDRVVIVWEII